MRQASTFIALQTCLAYFGSGLRKFWVPRWRDGTAVGVVADDQLFGFAPFARALSVRPLLTRVISWGRPWRPRQWTPAGSSHEC